jgi:site-specific recombinase XerD
VPNSPGTGTGERGTAPSDIDVLIQGYSNYLEALQVSPHTSRQYVYTVKRWAKWFGRPVEFFQQDEWDDWTRHLLEEGVEGRSVRRYQSSVRKFFKYLRRRKVVTHDPSYDAEAVKMRTKVVDFLSEEEVRDFFAVEQPPEFWLASFLMYANGLRNSEARALDASDLIGDTLRIRDGKGGKDRLLPVRLRTKAELVCYIRERSGPLFPGMTAQQLRRQVRRVGRRAGIKRVVRPHMLRHSIATHLLNRGMDLRFVQELLGHGSITSTQVYTHVATAALDREMGKAHPLA